VVVSGWDPEPRQIPDGLRLATGNPHAAADADLILSANLAAVAVEVAREVAPTLRDGQVYADMNTAAPEIKREIDRLFEQIPALFADVAIMSPILPHGLRTPTLVCGAGAESFSNLLSPLGMPVTVLHEPAGQAATQKLLRSIVYKGIAAVIIEALEAAQKLDMEPWIREQMMTILRDEAMIDRFVEGSRKHAARRIHEMDAVTDLLTELGVESYSSRAARQRLADLLEETKTESQTGQTHSSENRAYGL
jgi:3-hydroxyisobutyrate dehydrogenase-like beta-hydroxyacid dehydrogenase